MHGPKQTPVIQRARHSATPGTAGLYLMRYSILRRPPVTCVRTSGHGCLAPKLGCWPGAERAADFFSWTKRPCTRSMLAPETSLDVWAWCTLAQQASCAVGSTASAHQREGRDSPTKASPRSECLLSNTSAARSCFLGADSTPGCSPLDIRTCAFGIGASDTLGCRSSGRCSVVQGRCIPRTPAWCTE